MSLTKRNSDSLEILVPTYNRGELLKECLESVLSQIESQELSIPVSILIADNNSSDHTREVVESLIARSDISIKYTKREKNIGFSGNLTAGIAEATARWVWLLGDDDYLLPGAIQSIVSHITTGNVESCDVIAVKYLECEENLSIFSLREKPVPLTGAHPAKQFFGNGLTYLTFVSQYIIRREKYVASSKECGTRNWFTPHLMIISRMLSKTDAYAIDRYCVVGRRDHSKPSQWNGIWPVVYGMEYPDIIREAANGNDTKLGFLINSLNVRSWFVMSLFRDEYKDPFTIASKPSSWKPHYKFLYIFEKSLDWTRLRKLIRRLVLRLGGDQINKSLINAKILLGG